MLKCQVIFNLSLLLYYHLRKSCAPILVFPYQHDNTLDLYIVNDHPFPLNGTLTLTLRDFTGTPLKTQTHPATLPPNTSTKVATHNVPDLLLCACGALSLRSSCTPLPLGEGNGVRVGFRPKRDEDEGLPKSNTTKTNSA